MSVFTSEEGEEQERPHRLSDILHWTRRGAMMNPRRQNRGLGPLGLWYHPINRKEELESEEENNRPNELSDEAIVYDTFDDGIINNVQTVAPSTSSLQDPRSVQSQPRTKRSIAAKSLSLSKRRAGWPMDELPIELFENIAKELARRDVLNMRLVNHEFEKKISGFLFKVVVVPFQRQIYGKTTRQAVKKSNGDVKGKGKARGIRVQDEDEQMEDQEDDDHDGMGIFQAWGPHIKKFAMAFEFDEGVLYNPPVKDLFDTHNSFWGDYSWHRPHYIRYASCENLENKADEDRMMVIAFSHLGEISDLGLSLDGGLGWLVGPDQSDRAGIFSSKPEVFGSRFPLSSVESWSRIRAWNAIIPDPDAIRPRAHTASQIAGDDEGHEYPPLIFAGFNHEFVSPVVTSDEDPNFSHALRPNRLTPAQQEWLLETHWAQHAFLTSWCMAIVDNALTFKNLKTLKIARLSSRYLETLKRQDIWTAMMNLEDLTVMVLPDWRDVIKHQGCPQTPPIMPSSAADRFFDFLEQCIAVRENLTNVKIGYAAGGERAKGMYARNKHVLPAPIVCFSRPQRAVDEVQRILTLPHVEQLTFSNCWITPEILKFFVYNMRDTKMRKLVLDSVSLTAQTGRLVLDPSMDTTTSNMLVPSSLLPGDARGLLKRRYLNPQLGTPPDWLVNRPERGSWPHVMNTITPGENLDEKRYLYDLDEEAPPLRPIGSLREIKFISCGYARLKKLTSFDQSSLDRFGLVELNYVGCLRKRAMALSYVMMQTEDKFLGQIVTAMEPEEELLLTLAFGMTLGWGDDETKLHTREDGQPIGGSGRFNGFLHAAENPERGMYRGGYLYLDDPMI